MPASFKSPSDALVLGAAIRAARLELGLTQESLARRSGVERSQISKIERGQNAGLSQNVQLLCNQLGLSHRWVDPGSSSTRLGARVERVAARSPHWARVIANFVDVVEAAQQASSAGVDTV